MQPSAIPVANVYYLLSYAWDRLEEADIVPVSISDETTLPELFARILTGGVTRLLKQGLDRSYRPVRGEIAGVKGRLDLGASLKSMSFSRARAFCSFDELTTDVAHNQLLKSTLRRLMMLRSLKKGLREQLHELHRRMPDVSEVPVTESALRRVVLHRNNAYYGFLLDICRLIHRNLLVSETRGEVVFRDFTRHDKQMARLFERFLFRFYQLEQKAYAVDAPRLQWQAEGELADVVYLPFMQTDIVLRRGSEAIVIDAKYYAEMLNARWGRGTIRSSHLYQLFAYMRHVSPNGHSQDIRGILIYPRVTSSLAVSTRIHGHAVKVATVDLSRSPTEIREELLQLLNAA